ncbi:MAG: hypothetical protein H6644_04250 [Caldilineaceae bacterium]|nr:hypothetical protein [Caldilineaceae bacterium]
MVRLRFVSVWLTLVMVTVLVHPTPAVAGTLPEGTVPQAGRRILLPVVQVTQMPVILGAYLNPEVSPQYYGTLIDEFEGLVGQEHGIYHYYTHWPLGDFAVGHDVIFGEIAARGATPMLTFMSIPASGNNPNGCGDRNWNLDSIIDGDHDSYLRTFAQQVAEFDHTVLFRWGHEMNLVEYSWSGYCNGQDTQKFIEAYRHIVDIFRRQGADNVRWIWSPNYQSWPVEPWNDMHNYYPGDEYVDWIGLVGYNWGESRSDSGYRWATFDYLFDDVLRDMAARYPDKPVMLADFASVEDDGGDKAAWITDAFAQMASYSNLQAVVWHNFDPPWYDGVNFRVDSSSDALDAYQSAVQDDEVTGQAPYQ